MKGEIACPAKKDYLQFVRKNLYACSVSQFKAVGANSWAHVLHERDRIELQHLQSCAIEPWPF